MNPQTPWKFSQFFLFFKPQNISFHNFFLLHPQLAYRWRILISIFNKPSNIFTQITPQDSVANAFFFIVYECSTQHSKQQVKREFFSMWKLWNESKRELKTPLMTTKQIAFDKKLLIFLLSDFSHPKIGFDSNIKFEVGILKFYKNFIEWNLK
jgi:hypothetical protein